MQTNTKLIGTMATIVLATLAIVGLSMAGGAAVATEQVTIDDPANDTVEVDVDFSSAVDATVELINDSGDVVDSQTINGSAGTTETFTVSASEAGDYDVNLTTAGTESDVAINETRLVAERTVTVEDAAEDTVYVDLAFQGEDNATADIVLKNDSGTIYTDTVEYDATTDETTHTLAINETDGLVNGTVTAVATVNPASAYDAAYAGLEDPDAAGLFGGTILGQDTGVAIAGLLVLGGGWYYARREDLI